MSIDLSSITGASYNIFTGAANSKSFTITPTYPMYCGLAPSYEYQVIYSPASATPNLISLSSSTSKNIVFAQSSNPNDAATYSIIVNARFAGQTNWLTLITTAITTITYSDPCYTTTITIQPLTDMSTSVLLQTDGGSPIYESQTAVATDSVLSSAGTRVCGAFEFTKTVLSNP